MSNLKHTLFYRIMLLQIKSGGFNRMMQYAFFLFSFLFRTRDFPKDLILPPLTKRFYLQELPTWEKYYPVDVQGKIVLDAGANCGETAYFFLKHGASKVISIEPDPNRVKYIARNKAASRWNVDIIRGKLKPEHLKLNYDITKIDTDGGETILLDDSIAALKPGTIELHPNLIGRAVADRIVSKFNLKPVYTDKYGSVLYAIP